MGVLCVMSVLQADQCGRSVGGVWVGPLNSPSSPLLHLPVPPPSPLPSPSLFPTHPPLPPPPSDHAKPAKGAKHTGAGEMLFQVLDLDNSGEITFKGEPGGGVGGAGEMLFGAGPGQLWGDHIQG